LALDWRNANTLARQLLPQDAVYLSTRFAHMVRLCVGAQDGVACHAAAYEATTAFGMDANSGAACRHALLAACDAEILFSQLADQWRREFGVAPDFGVCVHLGVAAVAGMGDSVTNGAFVAGPAASALQDLRAAATLLGARAVVSMPVLHSVGVDPEGLAGAQAARGLTPDGVAFVALGSLQPLGAWLRR
jgi:adenylate cyclase